MWWEVLLQLVTPDSADKCTTLAFQALSCSLAWSDDHKDLICADGCERFWAIVRRNSKAAGDFNPAAAAIELLSDILYSAEQLGDWGYNVEQNGTALVTIVSEHAAFSSECVAAAANLVLKITCIAHELRFGETAIPIRNILKDLSTCLLRFRVEDDNDRTDALLDGLCDFIQTDAPVGYLDVRASGVLAAAVSCLATGTERLQSYTAYAAAKLVHATYTLAPRGSQHLI